MTLGTLTTEMQTLCHEGNADKRLTVHLNGKDYDVQKAVIGIENNIVVILTEVTDD